MRRIDRRRPFNIFSAFITRWMELKIATYSPSRTISSPCRRHVAQIATTRRIIRWPARCGLTRTAQITYYAGVETTHLILSLGGIILLAVAINVPLGYLRQNYEKFSFAWYFYVHISIPVIIYLRVKAGFSWKFIPLTLAGAIVGQLVGGYYNKRRRDHD
jgi:hypothetical protein